VVGFPERRTDATLHPLLQLDLTQLDHGHAEWPDDAVLLGYHAYSYEAARRT
jgi:hypothetical protein